MDVLVVPEVEYRARTGVTLHTADAETSRYRRALPPPSPHLMMWAFIGGQASDVFTTPKGPGFGPSTGTVDKDIGDWGPVAKHASVGGKN